MASKSNKGEILALFLVGGVFWGVFGVGGVSGACG